MAEQNDQSEDRLPTPDGCRWCGLALADHYRQWIQPVGWHGWTPPTDQQRKQRMLERRRRRGQDFGDTLLLCCG